MNKLNKLLKLFFGLELLISGITLYSAIKLNMFPTIYLIILVALLFILLLISFLLMFKNPNYKKSIVASVVAFLVILLNVYGISVLSKLNSTLDNISDISSKEAKKSFNIYVNSNNEAQSLEDLSNYTFYTNEKNYLSELKEELGIDVRYNDLTKIVDSLYGESNVALVLSNSYVTILEETESYSNFSSKTKIISEVLVKLKSETKDKNEVENVTNTPFILYISGSDTRSKTLVVSRSDVNILAVVNPNTKQVLLINTPRDYYVENPAGNNELDKLTHLGIYGIDNSVEGLSNLYGETINYYVQINFTGFEELIDAIGGVNVYSPISFTSGSYTFYEGNNYLMGAAALQFARERHALAGGDNDRGKNQMRVITAIIEKLTSADGISNYLTNYGAIMDSLQGTIVTDMSQENITSLVKMELTDMSSWDIKNFAVTGTGTYGNTYSMPGWNLYIMEPNKESVKYASKLIDKMLLNETLTDEDISASFADSPLDV